MQELRHYVQFDYDLRKPLAPQSKAKINKYYNALSEYKAGGSANGIHVFRPRNKKHLSTAQSAAGMNPALGQFKVAFINKPQRGDIKIKFTKSGKMRISTKNLKTSFIPLDPIELIGDEIEPYIERQLDKNKFPRYSINWGEYSAPVMSRDRAIAKIAEYAKNPKYSKETHHYYGDWMTGVWGLEFKNQADAESYTKAKNSAAKKRAGIVAKKRRAEKRKARK